MMKPTAVALLCALLGSFGAWGYHTISWRNRHYYDILVQEGRERNARFVREWLEELRKGRDGDQFWAEHRVGEPITLFAVRSWEVVDTDDAEVTVRIDSSNRE